ncbi:hypothetical protein PIIN_10191 [Serendipita indica DSM 11827]|uniref:Uncharacterized protein n=1 Tax=Serendipita indica (strain DSM 11827) TaxID=1109443 RepID=G4TY05_SERID|nr:hypothetical protein PIIN_10191 [Serendipita indica DSM 11827]
MATFFALPSTAATATLDNTFSQSHLSHHITASLWYINVCSSFLLDHVQITRIYTLFLKPSRPTIRGDSQEERGMRREG